MKPREDILFLDRLKARFSGRETEFSDNLVDMLHGLWLDGQLHGAGLMCDRCGETEGVVLVSAMTAYTETEDDPDPNHPSPYCPPCAEEHDEHWQAMWDEYHASHGV